MRGLKRQKRGSRNRKRDLLEIMWLVLNQPRRAGGPHTTLESYLAAPRLATLSHAEVAALSPEERAKMKAEQDRRRILEDIEFQKAARKERVEWMRTE
jgi:hypothetical protein